MRKLLSLLFVFTLMAAGCKDEVNETNPQDDANEVSDTFTVGESLATIQPTDLNEASGLANSRSNADYFWSHNDSGGNPRLFLLHINGADSGRYNLEAATNIDWEDVAIGAGPDDALQYLYVGDIGDNRAQRESLTIYRFPEPDLNLIDLPTEEDIDDYETIDYMYEDGARDAEALLVDPTTKDILIVSKREASVIIYKLPFPQSTSEMNTAVRVGVIPFTFITAGDISPDGTEVLLKNYQNIYYWKKTSSESIESLLLTTPERLAYEQEPQGEAIAWKTDGTGFVTLSEINNAESVDLIQYNRN